ncbi:CRISPR-associated endonuclease Cas2 [Spirochaeta cellobiosiphila]|uniref:CRISPR-associated endonuclease Cas2 n=1 Tax=Spirochaeta cellobiosiphila TaxID=504483 RepID=UPI0003FECF02|nr:CRISPR-associated endonuclease Cas2 [Spirochaeta cellobiosiphila]
MFVSVILDLGNDDSRKDVHELLLMYGFDMVQRDVYESSSLNEKRLNHLKLDIDKRTDYYDQVRIYQYPIDDTLVVTELAQKKWKRKIMRV